MDPRLTELIGVAKYEGEFPDFIAAARRDDDVTICKTHDEPESDDRAIYIVRNGLVATDSYRHYLSAVTGRAVRWDEVLALSTAFENWSAHLDAWRPSSRGQTLLVRYEDLVGRPETVVEALAGFLDREPVAAWENPWRTANSIGPNFFRRGLASVPETITEDERDAFMERHGAWMERLGYSGPHVPS